MPGLIINFPIRNIKMAILDPASHLDKPVWLFDPNQGINARFISPWVPSIS
jgi:hypothetical protein